MLEWFPSASPSLIFPLHKRALQEYHPVKLHSTPFAVPLASTSELSRSLANSTSETFSSSIYAGFLHRITRDVFVR